MLLGFSPCLIYIKSVIQRKVRVNCLHFQPEFLSDILSDLVLLLGTGKKEKEEKKERVNVMIVSGMHKL